MKSAWQQNVDLRRLFVTKEPDQSCFHGCSRTCAGRKATLEAVLRRLREIKWHRATHGFSIRPRARRRPRPRMAQLGLMRSRAPGIGQDRSARPVGKHRVVRGRSLAAKPWLALITLQLI